MKNKLFTPTRLTVLLLSFLLPMAILFVVYRTFGIYPFGDKSLLIMDLNGQSVDFFAYIRDIFSGDSNLIYSFSKGAGGNVVGLLAYYGALPFTFLFSLFPAGAMQEAIYFLNCLMVGLAGLTMAIFLQHREKKWEFSQAFFAICYALMTYSVIYSMQMQWLCGVIFLPLILLGIDRIVEEQKWGTFVLFYTLLLLANIYTGYMVTLFACIYFLWRILSEKVKNLGKTLLTFALSGIGGFALSAFWTVPAFLATMSGREGMNAFSPKVTVSYGTKNFFMKLFMGQYDSIQNTNADKAGTISIFCGVAIIAFLIYYFVNKKITLREKLCSAGVLLLLSLSVVFLSLDKVWHLFSYPNWFPYRWAFLFSFFLVFLAHRAFSSPEQAAKSRIRKKKTQSEEFRILLSFFGAFVVLGLLYLEHKEKFPNERLASLTLIFLIAYGILFYFHRKKGVIFLLIALLSVEMGLSSLSIVDGLDREFHYQERDAYVSSVTDMKMAVEEIEQMDQDPFYRVEKTDLRTDNDSMNVGYNGMTHYSSSFDRHFKDLDYSLGMVQEWYATRYAGATAVIDSLFGVRYVISDFAPFDSYKEVGDTIYRNPYALPLGFMAEGNVTAPLTFTQDYLDNQNTLYQRMTGSSIFAPIPADASQGMLTFTVTEKKPIYVAFQKKVGTVTMYRNGEALTLRDTYETKCKLLGTFEEGDVIEIVTGNNSATLAYLDEPTLQYNKELLTKSGLTVTEFSDTHIKGTVTTQRGGTMITTIPYDKGWTVKVDGKKVEITPAINQTFLSFPMDAGEHEVTITYRAPGMIPGMILSFLALLVLIFLKWNKKRLNHKEQ